MHTKQKKNCFFSSKLSQTNLELGEGAERLQVDGLEAAGAQLDGFEVGGGDEGSGGEVRDAVLAQRQRPQLAQAARDLQRGGDGSELAVVERPVLLRVLIG